MEIYEIIYITNGTVGVGYRLFNEIFYGMRIIMTKEKRVISPINDYSALNNKCSEFLYKPIEMVNALAMRKSNFTKIMKDQYAKKIIPDIAKNYKYTIQEPLHEHRDEMVCKFENRIDYVDISAYGVGKVKVDPEEEKNRKIEEAAIKK